MKCRVLLIGLFCFFSASLLFSQKANFYSGYEKTNPFLLGVPSNTEFTPSADEASAETNLWIGLNGRGAALRGESTNYLSTIPGTIEIDFTDLSIAKRKLGTFKVIKEVSMVVGVSDVLDEEFNENTRNNLIEPRGAFLGHLVLYFEDEDGYEILIDMGDISSFNGQRKLNYNNPNYTTIYDRKDPIPPRTWYLKKAMLHGVRLYFWPDEFEIFWIGMKGDKP